MICTTLCQATAFAAAPKLARAEVLTPPKAIRTVKADYPPEAEANGLEGDVVVIATVGIDGEVTSVELAEHTSDVFIDAALAAARQWRFVPALRDGAPIESQVRIPFHFRHAHALPPAPTPAPSPPPSPSSDGAPLETTTETPPLPERRTYESSVTGKRNDGRVGVFDVEVGALSAIPRANASDFLKLAPGVLLTNEAGEAHAEQVFLRGFDAREGQDIEFSVEGVPINESGNLHGNGYSDTHFIIPELVLGLRVSEGPFDPRQGNYAVAGSADYQLGLAQRGVTAKYMVGSYGTNRMVLAWGPKGAGEGTFVGAEFYMTQGYGQNRDGLRGSVMAQYQGKSGAHRYSIFASGYLASFHSAGVLRLDDVQANRVGFYGTYDPRQGEDAQRYQLSASLESRFGHFTLQNQVFGIIRPIRFRENFTGFLLDNQTELQNIHGQRGDLIDNDNMEYTVGAHGFGRLVGNVFHQQQELEVGYFFRGDFVHNQQARIEAATGKPYFIEHDLDSRLGDFGFYLDARLRFTSWLSLRGGVRADILSYEVQNNCANQTVLHPSKTMPPGDASCLTQEEMGQHIEAFVRSSATGAAALPRVTLVVGPWRGFQLSASYGQGVRSIDPVYITQDLKTPFASATAAEAGASFVKRLGPVDLGIQSLFFDTRVDRDLIFSETAGRNVLGGPSTRLGSASAVRLTGSFFDVNANLTYTHAAFDDGTGLVPYVPDLVLRFDGTIYGDLPWRKLRIKGKPLRGLIATGVTYVGPRPLPYGQTSDTIFTVDLNASIGWWLFDIGFIATNLLGAQYRLGEYNYVSDFRTQPLDASLVPARHFTAGAPRQMFFTISANVGGAR